MMSYKQEPVGVVANFTVTVQYSVSVYGDTEEDCWCAVEEMPIEKIAKEDVLDIAYDLKDVDSAGL
jgi:hypothetical protein